MASRHELATLTIFGVSSMFTAPKMVRAPKMANCRRLALRLLRDLPMGTVGACRACHATTVTADDDGCLCQRCAEAAP
jgi:hypothetical protein